MLTETQILLHRLIDHPHGADTAPATFGVSKTASRTTLVVNISTYRWCECYLEGSEELTEIWSTRGFSALNEQHIAQFLKQIQARELMYRRADEQPGMLDVPIKAWSAYQPDFDRWIALVHSNSGDGVFVHKYPPVRFHRIGDLGLKSWSSYLEHQLEFDGTEVGLVWNHWIRDRAKPKVVWRYLGEMNGKPLETYRLTTDMYLAGDKKHLYCDPEGILWCPITGKPLTPYFLT